MASVKLVVQWDYAGAEADECTLTAGDIIDGFVEEAGWWRGKSQGKVGIFPANFVKVAEEAAAPSSRPLPTPGSALTPSATSPEEAAADGGGASSSISNPLIRKQVRSSIVGSTLPPTPPGAPGSAAGAAEAAGRSSGGAPGAAAAAAAPKGGRGGGRSSKEHQKPMHLQFTLVAHNMGLGCSMMLVTLGLISIIWANSPDRDVIRHGGGFVGLYSLGLGVFIYAFQYRFGLGQRFWAFEMKRRFPAQGLAYIGSSVVCFGSNPTILPGVFLIVTGVYYCLAWRAREGELPKEKRAARPAGKKPKDDDKPRNLRDLQERGLLPKWLWLVVYSLINLVIFAEAFDRWGGIVTDFNAMGIADKPNGDLSMWTPWAKAFGQVLNFNCSMIIVPILRNLLLWVTKVFDSFNVSFFSAGSKETLYRYAPLSKTISFHKTIAKVVFFSAYMHTVAHFLNFGAASRAVGATFGVGPWVTGGIICLAMFFIYPAASDQVRRNCFRLFWVSHHWFLVFFLFLLFHGPVFIFWSVIPIGLFAVERLFRFVAAERATGFAVKELKWLDPVLAVYFCPRLKDQFKFKEGQYLYLCVPAISEEWHPFTISSAHDDLLQRDYVSVHMKVHKGGWTEKVKDYFEAMNPHGDYPLTLTHRDEKGQVQPGKYVGPEGSSLLRVDGPHSAPGEHYDKYETVMLIGAGIGLTPVASVLQAVTEYKWKRGFNPEILHIYWIVRQSELPGFQWFIGLLTALERDLQVDRAKGLSYTQNCYLEVNIFVTRADKDFVTPQCQERIENTKEIKGPGGGVVRSFTAQQLMELCCHPPTSSKKINETKLPENNPAQAPNRLQDVWCWDGRPNWDLIFSSVKAQRRYRDIGVCFCGTPIVGKDLKTMCKKYSTLDPTGQENEVLFRLHKENF